MKTKAVNAGLLSKSVALVLLVCLLSGMIFLRMPQTASAVSDALSPADLYEQNVNSTVGITISAKTTSRYGYGYTYQASGSGFIISEDGYILTNYHVIEDSEAVTVATYDNETFDAKVIGYDESNDIAVIKIEAENLKPVTMGDSDTLRVGDTVYAIGNPLGELTFSLTHGLVSALSRDVRFSSGSSMSLIQTDCAINSGNSGGALFNEEGEVIGITNAKYSASGYSGEAEIDNVGFAIPINGVKKIVMSIIENGYILKPYIGVAVAPLSEEAAGITGIKSGAVVQDVTEGAPADQAGVKINDVIVKVDDKVIKDSNDLVKVISAADPGDVMTFYLYRQGSEIELQVEIGSKTESALKEEEEAAETDTQQPEQQADPYEQYGQEDPFSQGNPFGGGSLEDFFNYYFGF